MVKGGLKRKKADKAKNQLKVSKKGAKKARARGGDIKLPKGLNVTNATFKTQKLVLLNQSKPSASKEDLNSGLVTKKKLGLKEVLGKLNNQSLSTRLDGLEGLKELVTAHRDIIDENLSLIVNRLIPFLSERENKLRHVGIPLLESILTQVKPSSLESLYPIISAHLCCGLSHIDDEIQLESIKVLDTVIQFQPAFILTHAHQILPNCLEQISNSDSNSISSGSTNSASENRMKSNKSVTKLRDNINANVSSLHWRFLVIERIYNMLLILLNTEESTHHSQFKTIQTSFPIGDLQNNSNIEPFYMNVYVDKYQLGASRNNPASHEDVSLNTNISNKFSIAGLARQLFPTLIDTWNEATTAAQSKKRKINEAPATHFLVQNESVPVCIAIINTLKTIMRLATHEEKEVSSVCLTQQGEIGSAFLSNIMDKFPFEVTQMKVEQRKNTKDSAASKISYSSFDLNLCVISYVVEWLTFQNSASLTDDRQKRNAKRVEKSKKGKSENNSLVSMKPIFSYLNGISYLGNELQPQREIKTTLKDVLKDISHICTLDEKDEILFNNLVSSLYNALPRNKEVVDLICYLMKNATRKKLLQPIYEEFVKSLPKTLLSENVTYQHVEISQLLLKANNQTFVTALSENLTEFPTNLTNVINRVLASNKEKDIHLLDEILKTVAIIFSNEKVRKAAELQEEKWRRHLKDSTVHAESNKQAFTHLCFCKNVFIALQG